MVEPISAAIIFVAATGFGVTVSATVASIAAYGIVTAATLGAGLLLQSLTGTKGAQERQEAEQNQLETRQSVPARVRGYGRVKLGGAKFFEEVGAADYLFRGLVHCEGPIAQYWEWWADSRQMPIAAGTLGGSASGTIHGTDNPRYESFLGTATQLRATLLAEFDVASPTPGQLDWTTSHRLQGLAYTVVRFTSVSGSTFRQLYPSGQPPETRVVIDASLVYDPRDAAQSPSDASTWRWSDNPALCIMDFLTSSRGMKLGLSRVNLASFAAFADVCDQPVDLSNGGTEARYRIGGVYDLNEEPREVLRRLLQTCDGEIIPLADGTLGIRGGVWTEPTVTITDAMVLSYTLEQANDRLAAFNRLKLSFCSPANDYQMTETEPWDDLANQMLTGEVLVQDMTLPMVQSHPQARRLAKISMVKGNPLYKITATCSLAALDALGERIVSLQLDDIGVSGTFLVTAFTLLEAVSSCQISLASLDASAYAWDAATEEKAPPPVPAGTSQATPPAAPTGVVAYQLQSDTVYFAADPINRGDVDLIGQYRLVGAPNWLNMEDAGNGCLFRNAVALPYEYQLAWLPRGAPFQSPWTTVATYTPSFATTAPSAVTALSAVSGIDASFVSRQVTVSWTASAAPYATARIYAAQGVGATLASAVLVRIEPGAAGAADSWVHKGVPVGSTWNYWIYAANQFGTLAAVAGPVSVTVT